jgi:hypothetical protein
LLPSLAGVLLCADPASSFACATCGCTLSADAAMGYSAAAGWRINLEDDYINQDQLRSGTGTAVPSQVVNAPSDPALGGGEIEKQTINRYLTLGINYSPNSSWNLNLLVPYVNRDHTTYGVQLAPYSASESAPDEISGAHVSGLGDIRLIGSYQGLLADPQPRSSVRSKASDRPVWDPRGLQLRSKRRNAAGCQPSSGHGQHRPHRRCVLLSGRLARTSTPLSMVNSRRRRRAPG